MTILVVRSDGSVIEMPDSAEHLHAQLHYENQAKAVDKRLMRTYQVKPTQGGLISQSCRMLKNLVLVKRRC